ncbi:hypothetical protein B0H14DRAFT_2523918 [Mycena olivaceomarginata]|nr:hypothetical protein B0H14DRAFT_2523918 [Mycena olivaceomarginata]
MQAPNRACVAHLAAGLGLPPARIPPCCCPKNSKVAPLTAPNYHGHEDLAQLSAKFITRLFGCTPDRPSVLWEQHLPYFIAYALHRTKLDQSVTFAALLLLQRLKGRFPSGRGSSGQRLFITAYMIASKVICDDIYSNKSWCIVAQGMFRLHEIEQMEREMCNYLDWELNVDTSVLTNFKAMVQRDFSRDSEGPYPIYPLSMVSRRAPWVPTSSTPVSEPKSTLNLEGVQRDVPPDPPATPVDDSTPPGEQERASKRKRNKTTKDNSSKDNPSIARHVLTEALRALKNTPGVALLRTIIFPLLDIIDKMQTLGCLHKVEVPIVEINLHGGENVINISGGTGGTGGAGGNIGGQGGTGKGPLIMVSPPPCQ